MVTEPALNVVLAEYLRSGLARVVGMPETRIKLRRSQGTRQPDIQIVDVLGVTIVVQGKIGNLAKAIDDCKEILNQGLADICFATAYPKELAGIKDWMEVKEALRTSKLEVALVKPATQESMYTIKEFGSLTVSELLDMFQGGTIYDEIVGEEITEQIADSVDRILSDVRDLPENLLQSIQNRVANLLGFTLKPNEKATLNLVKLALFAIFNAMIVQEALACLGRTSINPLSMKAESTTIKDWLFQEWDKILTKINYEPVFWLAVNLLQRLPSHPSIERILGELSNLASRIVASKALLKHDIAGRVYHTLLLKKVAKGLATYYTSIPAAYLLAKLAVETPDSNITWSEVDKSKTVICDLACGSGTLLSAAYSAILDRWVQHQMEKGPISDEDIGNFHRNLLQECLYGFDVLEYATHLAAAWLTLRLPEVEIHKLNIYTLPLGRLGIKGQLSKGLSKLVETYLGSLSMYVKEEEGVRVCVFPMATSLTGEPLHGQPESAGLTEKRREPVAMPLANLIIMNPPFARTGNVGKSILFGHLPKHEREAVFKKLRELLQKITKKVGPVGKAGLAAPFVWHAHQSLKENGRLALVLPRVMMSGPSWESIRKLLTSSYQINHIVVCYDPEKNWAWSENTVLSEILLVCTKCTPNENTRVKVTYVYHRPRSSLEAKILAARIIDANPRSSLEGELNHFISLDDINLGSRFMASSYMFPQKILSQQRNWNVCAGFASAYLSEKAWLLSKYNEFMGLRLPIVPLDNLVMRRQVQGKKGTRTELMIGFDVHTFQSDKCKQGGVLVDVLEGANIQTLNRLEVSPNKQMMFVSNSQIPSRMSNFLIAGVARFWLYTIGLVSVYCNRPAVSNTMWTVQLQQQPDLDIQDLYKIQTLWLNSTPGLLGFLSLRQDSKGAFIQFKREYLPMIKLIDVKSLTSDQRKDLLELFNKVKNTNVPNLPQQLEDAYNREGFRYLLDTSLLRILHPTIDERQLLSIYKNLLHETIICRNSF